MGVTPQSLMTRIMIHYHVFWTRPFVARQGHGDGMELSDFELLTWMTSALEIRRHSPVHLITDSLGLQFFVDTGMDWIYDEISVVLDEMPAAIHPSVFWDGGKMFAFLSVETPCVILDYDAILWQKLEPTAAVMALHEESREWNFYSSNREKFEPFGFDSSDWDWQANPVNTGLVYFSDERLPRSMGQRSVEFMLDYSAFMNSPENEEPATPALYNRATLFAGQRLLGLCAARMGIGIGFVTTLDSGLLTIARNPICSHLWISKALYRCAPEARVALVNHLVHHLNTIHTEARATLKGFGLDRPIKLDPEDRYRLESLARTDSRRQKLRRIKECAGDITIEDANLPVFRSATRGSLVLPGERLRPGPDARYELLPAEDECFDQLDHGLHKRQPGSRHAG